MISRLYWISNPVSREGLDFGMERQQDDDIWASEDDDDTCITNKGQECMTIREWGKVENCVEKDGFRQGLEADQEQALQEGFNTAFKQAFDLALAAGMFHGEVCATLQDAMQVPSKSGATGTSSSEQDTQKTFSLEEISDNVSSLIASIPGQLIQSQEIEQCCGTSGACQSCVSESNPRQKNTGEDNFNNSPEVKFLDKLTKLKLSFNSLIHS